MPEQTTEQFPVMPLRNLVLFPSVPIPLAVGRTKSMALVSYLMENEVQEFVTVAQRDSEVDEPGQDDLYDIATVVRVLKIMDTSNDSYTVIVEGVRRVTLTGLREDEDGFLMGEFSPFEEIRTGGPEEQALVQSLRQTAIEVTHRFPELPGEAQHMLAELSDPSALADFIISQLDMTVEEKQALLSEADVNARLQECLSFLTGQLEVSKVSKEISERIRQESETNQKEYYLRQQLKAIQEQLGGADEALELSDRIENSSMPEEAYEAAMKQFTRLSAMQQSSSEYSVTLNYIETLLEIPWGRTSEDHLDLRRAQEILDADHYGLDKVKDRIIEYLAVRELKDDMKGPILCLHGPPGVGKTSLAKSVARTLGRKFQRISLGGVHDESEIRGHRRTYVGALPGRIVQKVSKAETMNPVILLDEIDKVGRDFRGDPSAALLEVLDPEQNHTFSDHFLEVDLDLSQVLFIATANQLDTISPPLRDRMEIIDVPSYTLYEKEEIAKRHLAPKQIDSHGITEGNLTFSEGALPYIINSYTREAGVRSLERRLADICRSVAVQVAKVDPDDRAAFHVEVTPDFVQDALGPERHISEVAQRKDRIGVATGLAWTQAGGDILFIEAQKMPGKGELKLTGQLGDVMKESVQAAVTYIRANAAKFNIKDQTFKDFDVHLHVPAGAIPKDGPSAGITMFSAILSRLTDVEIRKDVAMTGEITLSGNVLPVGGIKEKIIAAHRAGIKQICMPSICRKDLIEVDDDVKADIKFYFVEHVSQLPDIVFVKNPFTEFNMGFPQAPTEDFGARREN